MLSKTYNICQIQTQFFNTPNEFETAGYNRQWAESEHWTIGSAALYLSYLWRFYSIYNSVYSSVIVKFAIQKFNLSQFLICYGEDLLFSNNRNNRKRQ